MRIVLTKRVAFSVPDGISHFLFSLADALMARGHEVVGLTTHDPQPGQIAQRFNYPHIPSVVSVTDEPGDGYRFQVTSWLKKGAAAMAALRPDLVLVNGAVPCRYPAPSIIIAHDADKRGFGIHVWPQTLYKVLTYRLGDRLVTTCSELVPEVARGALFPAGRISVIPTCITLGLYSPRPLAERRPAIVHIGLQGYKNPLATLRAFLPLAGEARLWLVGKVAEDVRAFVAALPENQRAAIELPGIVSDEQLKELLGTARVISVPSRYDAPVASPTVLEAFASHTPVVSSDSISRDLIEPGVNSFLARTEAEMTEAFARLLRDDSAWQTLSRGAAAAAERFSADAVAQRYLELGRQLVPPAFSSPPRP